MDNENASILGAKLRNRDALDVRDGGRLKIVWQWDRSPGDRIERQWSKDKIDVVRIMEAVEHSGLR